MPQTTLDVQSFALDVDAQTELKSGWGTAFAWCYVMLLTAASRIWTFRDPGPADAELFAYIGREWRRGVIPYKQIWDNKPPGIFAVNAFAALSHRQFLVLAAFEFVAIVAAIFVVTRILSELGCDSVVGWIAPLVAASTLTIPFYSAGGNVTEIYVLPFSACCIYAFLRSLRSSSSSAQWLLLSGVCAGMAAIFKPVGLSPLLAISAFSLVDRSRTVRSRIASIILPWSGTILIWGSVEGYFALHGAARQMLDASFLYNLHYGAATHVSIMKSALLVIDRLSTVGPVFGCVLAALLFWLWPGEEDPTAPSVTNAQRRTALLLFLWLAADLCGAMAGGRYYPHYFLPVVLSLVVVTCSSINILIRMISKIRNSMIVIGIVLAPIVLAGLQAEINYYHSAAGNEPQEWVQAATYINDHKSTSDLMFTWQFRPGMYRLANTHTVMRWDSAHYIYDFPAAYQLIGPELMSGLRATPPRFVVYDCSSFDNKADVIRTQMVDLLAAQYRLVYTAGATCVYVR